MVARQRSFLEEVQRRHDSGSSLDALGWVYDDGDGVLRIEDEPDGHTLLYYAARQGWRTATAWLLTRDANVHVGYPSMHMTPLHIAGFPRQCAVSLLLLEAGARVGAHNRRGQTALHYAAADGHTNRCKLLLSRGASLNESDCYDRDPEATARFLGSTDTAEFLAAVRAAGGWRAYCAARQR